MHVTHRCHSRACAGTNTSDSRSPSIQLREPPQIPIHDLQPVPNQTPARSDSPIRRAAGRDFYRPCGGSGRHGISGHSDRAGPGRSEQTRRRIHIKSAKDAVAAPGGEETLEAKALSGACRLPGLTTQRTRPPNLDTHVKNLNVNKFLASSLNPVPKFPPVEIENN
ncbi:hypothetical protein IFM12275_23850 [Nocardia sputorum]|nr:hypothetical protein IFM12275_23850 [Nocardia sputorum]